MRHTLDFNWSVCLSVSPTPSHTNSLSSTLTPSSSISLACYSNPPPPSHQCQAIPPLSCLTHSFLVFLSWSALPPPHSLCLSHSYRKSSLCLYWKFICTVNIVVWTISLCPGHLQRPAFRRSLSALRRTQNDASPSLFISAQFKCSFSSTGESKTAPRRFPNCVFVLGRV